MGRRSQSALGSRETSNLQDCYRLLPLLLRSKHFPTCFSPGQASTVAKREDPRAPHSGSTNRTSVPEDTGNGAGPGCSEEEQSHRDWSQKEEAGKASRGGGWGKGRRRGQSVIFD